MRKASGTSLCILLALALTQAQAFAISASATISSQQLSPTSYLYSITLTNTGTTNISTLWFGWIPAYDLLPSHPTAFTAPAGWTGVDAPDSFGTASAQWTTTTSPLAAGASLSGFTFTTPDSPAALAGTGIFGLPLQESYVYIGAPETDPGSPFAPTVVASTPEPSSLALVLGLPALLIRRKR